MKKYPADILAENVFSTVVTSKLSITDKNIPSDLGLYKTYRDDSFSTKMYPRVRNISKKYDKENIIESKNNGVSICTSSSSACGSLYPAVEATKCLKECPTGNCPGVGYYDLIKCSCNLKSDVGTDMFTT